MDRSYEPFLRAGRGLSALLAFCTIILPLYSTPTDNPCTPPYAHRCRATGAITVTARHDPRPPLHLRLPRPLTPRLQLTVLLTRALTYCKPRMGLWWLGEVAHHVLLDSASGSSCFMRLPYNFIILSLLRLTETYLQKSKHDALN